VILADSADPPSVTFDVSLGGAKAFAQGRTRMGVAGGAGNAEGGKEGGRSRGKKARKKVDPTVRRGRRRRTREPKRRRGGWVYRGCGRHVRR